MAAMKYDAWSDHVLKLIRKETAYRECCADYLQLVEKAELATMPREELTELAKLYQDKGLIPQTVRQVAEELTSRLTNTFLRDETGERPVYGGTQKFQNDPHWRDLILFYEYFHGDSGAGLGASHETGWTGLVATLIPLFGRLEGPPFLEVGRAAAFGRAPSGT